MPLVEETRLGLAGGIPLLGSLIDVGVLATGLGFSQTSEVIWGTKLKTAMLELLIEYLLDPCEPFAIPFILERRGEMHIPSDFSNSVEKHLFPDSCGPVSKRKIF